MATESETRREDKRVVRNSSFPAWIVSGLLFAAIIITLIAIFLWAALGSDFDILSDATILVPMVLPLS